MGLFEGVSVGVCLRVSVWGFCLRVSVWGACLRVSVWGLSEGVSVGVIDGLSIWVIQWGVSKDYIWGRWDSEPFCV